MDVYKDILLSINNLIQNKKLDRSDVADGTGIARSTLYNYLNGVTKLPLDNFIKMCVFLKVDPITLFPSKSKEDMKVITEREIDQVFELIKKLLKEKI